ncbi:LysR family transcriptional regulator [Shewanella sp. 10N.286.52.C2]|uniref:LysR family transcriptional regulator n=1 Tax=Shewanella sp. 10N.286.52.C2 TaxID=1880838 RepID=UPI000C8148B2|nr:LysR family transcriptional regulator [Shewanella sp. 10N.286.52.C2]PMG32066.1 LysR family transcriptional regulator [Shewanella sp. 10N.286.52.C2]
MNYDVSLLDIKLFLMTHQFGNFSEVARRLDMTPSSVSRKMNQLEEKVGTKLLHRHTRAISLTEEGIAFAKHSAEIIRQYDLVSQRIEQKADSPRGTVKISAPVAFARLHISPFLSELLELYPLLNLEIHQTDSFMDPAQEAIDLLVRIGVPQNSSMRMKQFATQNYVMAASPSYLKLHGEPKTPEELLGHNCLVFIGTKGLQRWFIGIEQLDAFDVSGSLYSNNADTLVSGAVGGSGIVLFPSWLINEELKAGKLVAIMKNYRGSTSAEQQTVSALYLNTDKLAPKVRVVIDFLAKKYGSPCYWDR